MPFNKQKFDDVLRTIEVQKITVYGPRVMILRDDPISETKGGIAIPEMAQSRQPMGTVVLLGQGYHTESERLYAEGVDIGDRVVTNQYDGKEFAIDTAKHGVLPCDVVHVGNLYLGYKNKEM